MEPGTRNLEPGRRRRPALYATAAYLAIALAVTWPLARGLGRDVASDLGDSLLAMWAVSWDCEQIVAILHGHASAALHYFDANIFHPAPLALAYSEHFTAQAIQALPVYVLTHNPILCYNLLFLSTFVLSGLGAYLFVRELTGDDIAAFVGGLLFAFAPYRMAESSHLQVLSAQWMPFALYGLRRYFASGRTVPLAGACAALVAEYLSSNDSVLYFTPFAAAFALWEIGQRRMWGNVGMWGQLAAAAIGIIVVTMPFLVPYLVLRDAFHLAWPRGEVIRYSADVYSYATAPHGQPLWGRMASAWPTPEGELFPGVVTLLLALAGVLFWRDRDAEDRRDVDVGRASTGRRALSAILAFVAVLYGVAFIAVLAARRVTVDTDLFAVRITNANQVLLRGLIAFVLVCVLSRRVRRHTRAWMRAHGFFVIALIAAAWLSLGPQPEALGRPLALASPYNVLYEHVGGFDALRAPARYGVIVTLMLATLGGLGAAVATRRRATRIALAPLALLFLAEGAVLPFTVNGQQPPVGLAAPEPRLHRPGRAPAIYARVNALPADAVLAELPLGDPDYDRRAMFYSSVHWRQILNGYGGFSPPHYSDLTLALSDVPRYPDVAVDAMRRLGATHVLVHEAAYLNGAGEKTSAALRQAGAAELYRDGSDVLLKLP